MNRPLAHIPETRAFSLTELLVTLAIIVGLGAIGVAAWVMLANSHHAKASVGAVMGTLAQARATALATKGDVWVLFGENGGRTGLVTLRREGTAYCPGNWAYLAPGSRFVIEDSSAVKQPVPSPVVDRLIKPGVSITGGVMFLPNGRIPTPAGSGGQLSITLRGGAGSSPVTRILLSRASGRATCP